MWEALMQLIGANSATPMTGAGMMGAAGDYIKNDLSSDFGGLMDFAKMGQTAGNMDQIKAQAAKDVAGGMNQMGYTTQATDGGNPVAPQALPSLPAGTTIQGASVMPPPPPPNPYASAISWAGQPDKAMASLDEMQKANNLGLPGMQLPSAAMGQMRQLNLPNQFSGSGLAQQAMGNYYR